MNDFAKVDYEYGVYDGDYLVRRFKTLDEARWFADGKYLKVKKFNFIDWNNFEPAPFQETIMIFQHTNYDYAVWYDNEFLVRRFKTLREARLFANTNKLYKVQNLLTKEIKKCQINLKNVWMRTKRSLFG